LLKVRQVRAPHATRQNRMAAPRLFIAVGWLAGQSR
jgi:hypothetical protein